jgi:hypothetical protein
VVMTTISVALSSLKTSVDVARTAIAVRDDVKLAEATQALNDRIIDVQNAALQLQEKQAAARDEIDSVKDEARLLRKRILELEQQKTDRAKYRLHELTEGVFVLAQTEPGGSAEPVHYLCQSCMDNATKKEVLQTERFKGRILLRCPGCKEKLPTGRTYKEMVISPAMLR